MTSIVCTVIQYNSIIIILFNRLEVTRYSKLPNIRTVERHITILSSGGMGLEGMAFAITLPLVKLLLLSKLTNK